MAQVEMKNVYINIVANNGSEKLLTKKKHCDLHPIILVYHAVASQQLSHNSIRYYFHTTWSNVRNPHTWRPWQS